MVVDARAAAEFASAHVTGTLNLPPGGSFVTWAGWLLPYDRDIHLIARDMSEATVTELVRQLALIGLDRVAGVFAPSAITAASAQGIAAGAVPQMAPAALARHIAAGDVHVLDVRNDAEWRTGHIRGATHVPLGRLTARLAEVPAGRPLVVQCRGGSRSAIAASLLRRLGRLDVANLTGGIDAWAAAGLPLEDADRS